MDIRVIEQALKKPGKSKKGLAAALGRQPSAVTALLKGERLLKATEIPVIEDYLDIGPSDQVPVVGYVTAGDEAYFEPKGAELERVKAPDEATPDTVAVEVRGDSLGKSLNGSLAFYDDVRSPVTEDLVGRLCVVGLTDGRVVIKRLRSSRLKGRFHLYSEQEPMLDVKVEWAAAVKQIRPR